jgi:hypothetical protein
VPANATWTSIRRFEVFQRYLEQQQKQAKPGTT